MSYRVSISPEVASQILATSSYLDGMREGLGLEFEQNVESILGSIAANPHLYPKEFGPVRRAFVSRFKQVIFYTLRGDAVVIVELRDARREPPDWEERRYPPQ